MITTASEMKNRFGQFLKHVVEKNGEVIVTKNNERVARLVPYITDIDRYFTIRENAVDYEYDRLTVSYEEFMEIYEKSDSRMEYINGQIYVLSSPDIAHQAILGNLHILFKDYFKGKKCRPFIAPLDIHFRKKDISDPDVMQPDLVVISDLADHIDHKRRYTGTPVLVVEILSTSTRSKDMVYKLNTFMMSGVSEYWMADPDNKRIAIYNFANYQIDRMEIYKTGDIARSVSFEGLSADVGLLFDDEAMWS